MRLDIITLFPGICAGPLNESILKRAQDRDLVSLRLINLRDFARDRHRTVDDRPFGGGAGMVLKPEPLSAAIESVKTPEARVVLLTPQGERFTQTTAQRLAAERHLILVCGHYEGVDERLLQHQVDEEISLGDYVLSGGELPAMVLLDAVIRQIPGALGHADSASEDSFADGLLDCPHYTRPEDYLGLKSPPVLRGGNHAEVSRWRLRQALKRTSLRRPDLLERRAMSPLELELLGEIHREAGPE